jgi:hypothetical protein
VKLVISIVTGLAVVGTCAWFALHGGRNDSPGPLRVGWGGEGRPSCVYDSEKQTVVATLLVRGGSPQPDRVTATVTAYADENTSEPVGSGTDTTHVEGTVRQRIQITIPVTARPHVDEDGVTACRLSARSRHDASLPLF